jgi:hypothetical protein
MLSTSAAAAAVAAAVLSADVKRRNGVLQFILSSPSVFNTYELLFCYVADTACKHK